MVGKLQLSLRTMEYLHVEAGQSKPVSHTAAGRSKLVSYTDSSSEEEEDLHVDVNFDEPIDLLAINQFSVFKIEFQKNK